MTRISFDLDLVLFLSGVPPRPSIPNGAIRTIMRELSGSVHQSSQRVDRFAKRRPS